jgi:hypothetical protein
LRPRFPQRISSSFNKIARFGPLNCNVRAKPAPLNSERRSDIRALDSGPRMGAFRAPRPPAVPSWNLSSIYQRL